MTVDCGQRNARIRLQGQTKDVYQAESRVKEMLHKIKSEQTEQEQSAVLSQLVGLVISTKMFSEKKHFVHFEKKQHNQTNIFRNSSTQVIICSLKVMFPTL